MSLHVINQARLYAADKQAQVSAQTSPERTSSTLTAWLKQCEAEPKSAGQTSTECTVYRAMKKLLATQLRK